MGGPIGLDRELNLQASWLQVVKNLVYVRRLRRFTRFFVTENRSLQSVKSAESVEGKPFFFYALRQESSRGLNLGEIYALWLCVGPSPAVSIDVCVSSIHGNGHGGQNLFDDAVLGSAPQPGLGLHNKTMRENEGSQHFHVIGDDIVPSLNGCHGLRCRL